MIPNIRRRGFRFAAPSDQTNGMIQSSIFWGFYESAETRLIEKYLQRSGVVIELGGSLGIVSSHIVSKLNGGKLIIVEANPKLLHTINRNTSLHNKRNIEVIVVNKAVSYKGSSIFLHVTENNTASRIGSESEQSIEVACIQLSDLVDTYVSESFSLVCDIEGCEVDILVNDTGALTNCSQIFMELHKTDYNGRKYTTEDVLEKLCGLGFELVERDGNVVYMENSRFNGRTK
jgi:FkbM family methyltransferase